MHQVNGSLVHMCDASDNAAVLTWNKIFVAASLSGTAPLGTDYALATPG